jgi:hypothetical protein
MGGCAPGRWVWELQGWLVFAGFAMVVFLNISAGDDVVRKEAQSTDQ